MKTGMRNLMIVCLGLVVLSVLLAGPMQVQAKDPYKIGIDNSLTGQYSVYAVDFQEAIELAVAEINAKGGINGHPVELVIRDDESDAVNAANNIRSLAASGVLVMTGMASFDLASAAAPVVEEVKLPTVQLAPIDPPYIQPGGYNFGGIWWTMESVTIARLAACARHGLKRAALLMPKDPVGEITSKTIKDLASKLGVEVVGLQWMLGTDTDVTPQLIKLKRAKPDVVVNGGSGRAAVVMYKSLKRLGWNIPMVTLDANTTPSFIETMGEDADIVLAWAAASGLRPDAIPGTYPTKNLIEEFAAMWKKKTGKSPGSIAAQGYDAVRSLFPILEEVNPDPANQDIKEIRAKIRDALENQCFQGMDWKICRTPKDHKGAGEAMIWIAKVDGQSFVPVTKADMAKFK